MIFFVIVLYDSREVEFDSPAKLDISYFFTKKNVCLREIRDRWGAMGAETDNCYVW